MDENKEINKIENGVIYFADGDLIYTDAAPSCLYNNGVGCLDNGKCGGCGWNPKVIKRRNNLIKYHYVSPKAKKKK